MVAARGVVAARDVVVARERRWRSRIREKEREREISKQSYLDFFVIRRVSKGVIRRQVVTCYTLKGIKIKRNKQRNARVILQLGTIMYIYFRNASAIGRWSVTKTYP